MSSADETFSGFTARASSPEPGYFFDFLGTRTRTEYLPESCQWLSGRVFGFPTPADSILHEYEEWQGVMAAVRDAQRSFVCVELGAGWGPWLLSSYFAAQQRGIRDISLIGVEADARSIGHMKTHFSDNGLDHNQHKIVHAAVNSRDGPASASNPGGAPMISLRTILATLPVIDLIHCDIQFAESKAIKAGIRALTNRVRRIIVGTHSRRIEDELIDVLQHAGWQLENEKACKYGLANGAPYLMTDGVQVWRNPRERFAPIDQRISISSRYAPRRIWGGVKRRTRRFLAKPQ